MGETRAHVGGGGESRRRRARRCVELGADVNAQVEGALVPGVQVDDVRHGQHRAAARRLDAADACGASGRARRREGAAPTARHRPEPPRSGRHDGAGRRHHQRPLRLRRDAARQGRRSEHGRQHRHGRALFRSWTCTRSAPMQGRPAPKLVDTHRRRSAAEEADRQGRQPQRRLLRPMLGRYHGSGDASARRGHDAVPARGQGRGRAVDAGAARRAAPTRR